MGALPSIQGLWEKHGGKGLRIFLAESQGGSLEEIKKYAKEFKPALTFPITIGGGAFSGYKGGNGLPYAFVVGPDAKVVWQGSSGYDSVIEQQLKRIKYPGLGKLDVVKELESAAMLFGTGEFAKASEQAAKVKEKKGDEAAVAADADWVIQRVSQRVSGLRTRIDVAKTARRYHDAQKLLEELSGKGFKGMEEADKAAAELKEMKADKAVQKEIKAWAGLAQVIDADKKNKDAAARKRNLEAFAKKSEGTAAAEEAIKLSSEITAG